MKKAHVISHTHWDREWFLPYEEHHMYLVEFMDTLIETLENDKDFKSFHLDGQTIMVEDYLQVRPDRRERVAKLIRDGRIVIGPWYILQDEFLTSSEANIRNLQYGHKDASAYGQICKLGYFPDSFGNMGQAPQIIKDAGITTAAFGRGVKPTGFNNQVGEGEKFESPYSEMYWESNDGSRVLGVLFANWYNNGMEVPTDKQEAKVYWDKKLADAQDYASTDHLLFLNGCDHQPVQTDLSAALRQARELYPDVEFIHSNFMDYIDLLNKNVPEDLKVVKGELRSQQTNGWYTLANTASSRVYLKQMNANCQMLFEKVAEPLAVIAHDMGKEYPHHMFEYGWKILMQNHPHDSICGCSVDSVHREMVSRFEKAEAVANYIIKKSMEYIANNADTASLGRADGIPLIVTNTTGWLKSDVITSEVQVARNYFSEGPLRQVINKARDHKVGNYRLLDQDGNVVPATIKPMGLSFDYDLPKDKFRQPYSYQSLEVSFEAKDIKPFSFEVFTLVEVEKEEKFQSDLVTEDFTLENDYVRARVNEDGSIDVTHKASGHTFKDQCIYENHGDIGNEYIYMQPVGEKAITSKGLKADIKVVEDKPYRAAIEVSQTMMIPARAEDLLEDEIKEIIEFKDRKSQRVDELVPLEITSRYSLEKSSRGIKVKTSFNNQALDHRLRVLFETKIDSDYHYADSIFEVAKRDTVPSRYWENPCNAQHQQDFINIRDDKIGLTIANKGLNEYEVLRDGSQVIAVTLHRGVRELGDWGVFMTPEAQCLGEQEVEFMIIPHGAGDDVYASYQEAYQFPVSLQAVQTDNHKGNIKLGYQLMDVDSKYLMFSSLKLAEGSGDIIGRWYNLSNEDAKINFKIDYKCYKSNVLEEKLEEIDNLGLTVAKAKIVSLGFYK